MSYEDKTFLSKLKENYNQKFGNFALTSTIQKVSNYVDKDGNSETDTLIHNSFVKYFESKGQPYPEWLGIPNRNPARMNNTTQNTNNYQNSQYKPVYSSYNTPQPQQQPQSQQSQPQQGQMFDPRDSQGTYKPRSSRLQDMHNKSRQQHIPAAGYNTVNTAQRSNSRTSGSRLRERMMNSNSMTNMNNLINDQNGGRR